VTELTADVVLQFVLAKGLNCLLGVGVGAESDGHPPVICHDQSSTTTATLPPGAAAHGSSSTGSGRRPVLSTHLACYRPWQDEFSGQVHMKEQQPGSWRVSRDSAEGNAWPCDRGRGLKLAPLLIYLACLIR